nr:carboxypeptidase-like regulatory domain-containing protein [FCB group bacterium]
MRNKRLLLTAVIILLSFSFAHAGVTGKISGRVIEMDTGEPLPGVNVVVEGTTLGSTTDLDGFYFILNVPVGMYTVKASMVGYTVMRVEQVVVTSDLTTRQEFTLAQATLDLGEVVVTAEKPMIEKDVTSSRTIRTSADMMAMPVDNVFEVVNLTAGTVGDNFRGGRNTEVMYLVDGASIMDPVAGVYRGSIPSDAVEE